MLTVRKQESNVGLKQGKKEGRKGKNFNEEGEKITQKRASYRMLEEERQTQTIKEGGKKIGCQINRTKRAT